MRAARSRLWLLAAAGLALLAAAEAWARPGGGQSFSGGSSGEGGFSGGGGGGDGGGMILYLLFRLVVEAPAIGIPACGIAAYVYFKHLRARDQRRRDAWSSVTLPGERPASRSAGMRLADIRERDPEFSAVLFYDFVSALYARTHGARGDREAMAALAPYVSKASRRAIRRREPAGGRVRGVVLGRVSVVDVEERSSGGFAVDVVFESNIDVVVADGDAQGQYVRERWRLVREGTARSRPPERVTAFGCPACGAPFERSDAGACGYCGREVDGGRFDWCVVHVRLLDQSRRPPPLTHHAEEEGTDAPTLFAPDVRRQLAALVADDPGAAPAHLEARARLIFGELNAAWSARELKRARPHVSDQLFTSLSYWIEAYRQSGLRNVLEDMEMTRFQVARVERDRHFDAVTARIWGRGRDYTVTDAGRRVSGSARHPRVYSEYWTLIRGAGVRGQARASATCPGCGAGLEDINMAGACGHCGAHLTRGEFDWVLSRIEQDEAYRG